MYIRAQRFVWVTWEKPDDWQEDDPDYTGFRAKILANPTAGDVFAEMELRQAVLKSEATGDDYLQHIAPRVPEWDYQLEDASGTVTSVPAPGAFADNWEAFRLLEMPLHVWLCTQLRTVHLPKAMIPGSRLASTTGQPSRNGSVPESVLQNS